jgi:folate-binding protein YgfZ
MTLQDEYQTLKEHAVVATLAPRGQVGVSGADRASYLHGLLTNDIQALSAGHGCYAAWLTPQGRMLTDLHVLESGDMILLDLPLDQVDATLQRLDGLIFSEDVQLSDLRDSLRSVWVHGPSSAALLERVLTVAEGLASWAEYQNGRLQFAGGACVVARISQLGVPGYCVYVAPSQSDSLVRALTAAGAPAAGRAAVEAARIEAGYPLFGVDMDDHTIPLEAGIEGRAISLSKGCYVGQEIIIRVLHRGGGRVVRKLVGLRLEGPGAAAGAAIRSGDREIGSITSVAASPRLGSIALGYVHRDFAAPATRVDVDLDDGAVPAVVIPTPMLSEKAGG